MDMRRRARYRSYGMSEETPSRLLPPVVSSVHADCPACRGKLAIRVRSVELAVDYFVCRSCSHAWNLPKAQDQDAIESRLSV